MKKQPGGRSEGSSSDEEKPELGSRAAAAIEKEMLKEWGLEGDELEVIYKKIATLPLRKLRPEEVTEPLRELRPEEVTEKLKENQELLAKLNETQDQYRERRDAIFVRYERIDFASVGDLDKLVELNIIPAQVRDEMRNIEIQIAELQVQELNETGAALLERLIGIKAKFAENLEKRLAEIKQHWIEDRQHELDELSEQLEAAVKPHIKQAREVMSYPEVFNSVHQEALIFQERAAVEQGDPEYRLGFSAMEAMADRQKNAIAEIERVTGLTGVREMMIQAGRDGGQATVELKKRLVQAAAERTDEVVPEKVNPIIAPKNSYTKRRAGLAANKAPLKSGLERIATLGDERAKGQLVTLEETGLLDGVFESISSWIGDVASRRSAIKFTREQQERTRQDREDLQKFDHGGPSKFKDKGGEESTATVFKGEPDQAAIDELIRRKGSGVAGRGNGAGEKAVVKEEKIKNERRTQMDARLEQRIGDLIRRGTDGRLAARVEVPPSRDRQDKIIGGHYGAVLVEPTLRGDGWEVLETVATGEYVRPGEILTTAMLIERLREFRTLVPKEEAGK
ncbi:MAG: hypothetical protein V1905_00505 [bacterium]